MSDIPREIYTQTRRDVRTALNLQKFWAPVPTRASAASRTAVACPAPADSLVVMTGGQSNAANSNTLRAAAAPGAPVYTWFDGRCYRAEDPMLGASGQGGSLWPPLGEALSTALGRPVLFINGAIGGTQVADWLDPRSGYYAALVERARAAMSSGYTPELILWHQGETDALIVATQEAMEGAFAELVDRLHADIPGADLYLFQASKCMGAARAEGVAHIRAAQRAVAARRAHVFEGMSTDALGDDFRWDSCHFNSLGRSAIVAEVVPHLLDMLASR